MSDFKIELLEYVTEDGHNPFHKWLNLLKDRVVRARIRVRLNRVRLGNFGDCKSVGKGVSELRVDYGPGYRVYFGKTDTTIVLLLCGGSKKSQSKDIQNAHEFWADFQRRAR
ncbi:type II toxin-antitoxin system RelE/ParE family toxin [Myxococcota bacterium]|nr:type II toxin-antitoxin system RelE/ParE family toxin [Myxococcota bacterium]MBU1536012.1 type II toxin-antitoxin system RelE/ParE family toxin [Myxococcota bacterium]